MRRAPLAIAVLLMPLLLGGCDWVLLAPSGDVAVQQRNILYLSTALMLVIIIPVLALTVFFAWRYRASANAKYEPDWHHSLPLEVVIWAVPLLIIIVVGAITWMGTHLLDPYRPLGRIAANKPIQTTTSGLPLRDPLKIQVVAMDWKWLFLYPKQGVASLNEVVLPVDQPVEFNITSSSVMNSFFIPALAGQIYAMPGMQTKLNAVINHPGEYEGFSANFSGPGFNGMRFKVRGVDTQGFDQWVQQAAQSGTALGRAEYLTLEKPSQNEAARQFSNVAPDLYGAILGRCVDSAKMCSHDMMAIDARGGGGKESALAVIRPPRQEDAPMQSRPFVLAICTATDIYGTAGQTASLAN